MGEKWSSYYEGLLRGLLEDELDIRLEVRTSPDVCLARFDSLELNPQLEDVPADLAAKIH
jgi:hypothetical protein